MKTKTLTIKNYQKFWITDTPQGHLITICYGKKGDSKIEINLRWQDRKRDKNTNRVVNAKTKSI